MDTAERFIRAYEDLCVEVNRRANNPSSHNLEIEQASNRDGFVMKNRTLLKYIRDVRHALQHPKHTSPGHALQVSEGFLKEVEDLLLHIKNPPTARSVGIRRKNLRVARMGDRLGDLADEMKQKGFSHVPILDERDVVIGVFNEAAVFDYLWTEAATLVERDMLIESILDHCRLTAERTETFKFVPPTKPLTDVVDIFLALESPLTRVGAVFVTASGKHTEPLQCLITPWDVLAAPAGEGIDRGARRQPKAGR